VSEGRVLRKTSVSKRDQVTKNWRRLHIEDVHDPYSSTNIIRRIKYGRMRWAGHVARMVKKRDAYRVLVGISRGKSYLKDRVLDLKTMLKRIFKE
jgi:hypothetical protein